MPELIYQTTLDHPGPWLLDQEKLASLDAVIDKELDLLAAARNKLLEALKTEAALPDAPYEVRAELRRLSSQPQKVVLVAFKSGKSVEGASFDEVDRALTVADDTPKSATVLLKCGEISASLRIGTGWKEEGLSLSVEPSRSTGATELFSALRNWTINHKPPKWQEIWARRSGMQWPVFFLMMLLLPLWPSWVGGVSARNRAAELLMGGLSNEEVGEAVELLLRKEFDLDTAQAVSIGTLKWLLFLMAGGLALAIGLSVRPKVELAIGRGSRRIVYWRYWLKFLGTTLPLYLLAGLWGYLEPWVSSLWK